MSLDDFFKYVRENTAKPSSIPQGEIARNLWNGFNNNPDNRKTVDAMKGMAGIIPGGPGDVASGLLAADDVRRGDFASGLLNAIGAFPLVPAMGGIIKEIPAPVWKGSKKTIKVGVDPTNEELDMLSAIERQNTAPQSFGDLRLLKPTESGNPYYFWPASDAMHNDVGAHFNLDPNKYIKGLLDKD